jgi:hypothetical protein
MAGQIIEDAQQDMLRRAARGGPDRRRRLRSRGPLPGADLQPAEGSVSVRILFFRCDIRSYKEPSLLERGSYTLHVVAHLDVPERNSISSLSRIPVRVATTPPSPS